MPNASYTMPHQYRPTINSKQERIIIFDMDASLSKRRPSL